MRLRLLVLSSVPMALGSWFSSAPLQDLSPSSDPAWPEVRSILERRCLECHGGEKVKSEFRLATAETFRHGGARGPAFDAENPSRSRILEVIEYQNPDLAMPPSGALPEGEVEVLRQWILAGAPWPEGDEGELADPDRFPEESGARKADLLDWWAYRALEDVEVPPIAGEFGQHPIDAFLESRRLEEGTEATDAAPAAALLRRASFDLIGLPPTPEELSDFLERAEADFDGAWEAEIDRLLESPHYGEHQARRWLDLVRYADSNGYERDNPKKNIWRYRDYVVRSYQNDKPFDRFGIEQLAGDEFHTYAPQWLGDAGDPDPLLATGYYRLTVWDDEPADRPQARADELADIVDTTGQAFLGTTVGCARCHDHKADPFSQADYYSLTGVFNHVVSFAGPSFNGRGGGSRTKDIADRPGPGQITSTERDARVAALNARLDRYAARVDPSGLAASKTLISDARGDGHEWTYIQGNRAPAGWEQPGFDDSEWQRGRSGFGRDGTPGGKVRTPWTNRRIRLRTTFRSTEIPDALHLTLHHDEDVRVWLNGIEVFSKPGYQTGYEPAALPAAALSAMVVGRNVLAVECAQTVGGQYIDVGLHTGLPDAGTDGHRAALRELVISKADDLLSAKEATEVRRLAEERQQTLDHPIARAYPALVASEPDASRPEQRVLLRGSVYAPGDAVELAVPAAFRVPDPEVDYKLPRIPQGAQSSGRRFAFARWLFREGSHLSARVLANRLWQSHFGKGLCPSPGDFGRLGQEPTHPELLDHLAAQVLRESWSVKAMHRYIMTSRAYRMSVDDSSAADAKSRRIDPTNESYWHFPPRRLTAEQYRDAVLAISGQLNRKRGGPSIYPKMQEAARQTASRPNAAWPTSPAKQRDRRSLYVYTKRTLGFPLLQALDRPDPDIACPERFPTNVPTQSLMLLNGEFTNEQAGHFADRLLADHGEAPIDVALQGAARHAYGREFSQEEVTSWREFFEELRRDHDLDRREALRLIALALYNSNEFLWID